MEYEEHAIVIYSTARIISTSYRYPQFKLCVISYYFYSCILILKYYYHLFYILSGNCLLLEYNSIRYNLIFSEGILAKPSTAAVCQLLFGEVQGALQQRQ